MNTRCRQQHQTLAVRLRTRMHTGFSFSDTPGLHSFFRSCVSALPLLFSPSSVRRSSLGTFIADPREYSFGHARCRSRSALLVALVRLRCTRDRTRSLSIAYSTLVNISCSPISSRIDETKSSVSPASASLVCLARSTDDGEERRGGGKCQCIHIMIIDCSWCLLFAFVPFRNRHRL